MIIAKTQEESDLLCEQEISHILRIERNITTLKEQSSIFLVDNERQRLVSFNEIERQATVRTKKYGTLVYFERIRDMLDSKYNKGVLCVYCSSVKYESKKKYTLKTCNIETQEESYEFRDKESSDNNFAKVFMDSEYETNKIKEIEPFFAYLLVIQRDKSSTNGVRITDSYKINIKN